MRGTLARTRMSCDPLTDLINRPYPTCMLQGAPNTASQETIIRPSPRCVSGFDCRASTASQAGQVVCLGRVLGQVSGGERRGRILVRRGRRRRRARRREKRRMVRVRLRVTNCTTGSHHNQSTKACCKSKLSLFCWEYLCQTLFASDLASAISDIMEAASCCFAETLTSFAFCSLYKPNIYYEMLSTFAFLQ